MTRTKWFLIVQAVLCAVIAALLAAGALSLYAEGAARQAEGDLFYYTVKTATEQGEHFWALRSSDFSLVDTLARPYPHEWSFPGIRFTSSSDGWVKPRL